MIDFKTIKSPSLVAKYGEEVDGSKHTRMFLAIKISGKSFSMNDLSEVYIKERDDLLDLRGFDVPTVTPSDDNKKSLMAIVDVSDELTLDGGHIGIEFIIKKE